MKVKVKKTFMKDLQKLPENIKEKVQNLVFRNIPAYNSINEIKQLRKIRGYENYYRIRIGKYRIGFELRGEIAVFYRILHRKDIYKYFP